MHPDPGRGQRGRVRGNAAGAQHGGHHLRLRHARRHPRRPVPLPATGRPGAADRADQRLPAGPRRAVHLGGREVGHVSGGRAPGLARPHPDRDGDRAGALRAGDQEGGRVPGGGQVHPEPGPVGPGRAHHLHRGRRAGRGVPADQPGATAIVCGSDIMAFGAVRAVRGLGLSVPHDVSVVGFDDSSVTVFSDPPLTTLRQPVQAMGTAAVRGLIDEINSLSPPRGEFIFRTELLARSSTGPAPSSS
nr:substrate-binding domain-containing protein [Acrocarpospora corrugata]